MPTPITSIGNKKRDSELKGNLYKIDSPYDLNSDIVTKSINLLNNITGFDYRNNTILNVVERLVDAQNSDLLQIGASRLLVEFGRRSVYNMLDGFIPSPNDFSIDFGGSFKKHDRSITDPNKNPGRTFTDRALEGTIGYRSNDNYLLNFTTQSNLMNYKYSSNIYFYYSGKLIQDKIKNLGNLNNFSTFSDKSTIDYSVQSTTFQFTYDSDWLKVKPDLLTESTTFKDTQYFTHAYFKNYQKESGKIEKDYIQERKNIEKDQGFGSLVNKPIDETKNIGLQKAVIFDSRDSSPAQITERQDLYKNSDGSFIYDSNYEAQDIILEDHKVKRGLIYFTSRLALENDIIKGNNIIAQNKKEIYTDVDVNPNVVYYKGNGECRTFTVYQQHDNFNRLIRFDGNSEKNSVLKDSVMPKIAPFKDDSIDDRRRYFFTMENLAVKVTDDSDGDQGPNGGRWMWFPPYDVKISDNNQVNWSDMNFLGRPEPIFSYQNTTRSLSLSFRLLIDTVKEMQDLKSTIENYRAYLHSCGEYLFDVEEFDDNKQITDKKQNDKVTKQKIEPKTFNLNLSYFFKNGYSIVKTTNIDYTSGDNCFDSNKNGNLDSTHVSSLSSSTLAFNQNFSSSLSSASQILADNIGKADKIEIDVQGLATDLFQNKKSGSNTARNYNKNIGYARAYSLMYQFLNYYNTNNQTQISLGIPSSVEPTDSPSLPGKEKYDFKAGDVTITVSVKTKGDSLSVGPSTYENRNDPGQIQERNALIKKIKVTFKPDIKSKDTNVNEPKLNEDLLEKQFRGDLGKQLGQNNDPALTLGFEELKKENKFPTGFEKLNVFTPSFNSQTPFDFTKRYVFLHQLTRPSRLRNNGEIDNTVFGRMPVFILRYGDFLHTKAIARSINFDITESTWDLNPEGMGAIPLMCTVTMDLTLLGGQSLAGPIDRIQTASDSSFIANTSFNSGRYYKNVRFASSRKEEGYQYKGKGSGEDKKESKSKSEPTPTPGSNPPVRSRAYTSPITDTISNNSFNVQNIPSVSGIKNDLIEGGTSLKKDLYRTKEAMEKQEQRNKQNKIIEENQNYYNNNPFDEFPRG